MAALSQLDPRIARLVRRIRAEFSTNGARRNGGTRRLESEIKRVFECDYASCLCEKFDSAEIRHLLHPAAAVWPAINRALREPPSGRLFAEVSQQLNVDFNFTPYRRRDGFAIRGFYLNESPYGRSKPLIYVNSAHPSLLAGVAFCHEVGHHLSAGMFRDSGELPRTALHCVVGCSARVHDRIELAADILVSLAGYPKSIASRIFSRPGERCAPGAGTLGAKAFVALRDLRSRYDFDFNAGLGPIQKLYYLAETLHYLRLREVLLAEFDL